jgi:hypothetical protein
MNVRRLVFFAAFGFSADIFNVGFVQGLRDRSVFNPDNVVLKLPQAGYLLDLRPRMTASLSGIELRLEPRARLSYDDAAEGEAEVFFTQAYADAALGAQLRLRLGVQNYQWGPAELLAPSNPFFRAKTAEQGYLFEQRGRVLARLDVALNESFNLALVAEPLGNGEDERPEGEDFEPRSMGRMDYQVAGTLNSAGLTAGKGPASTTFIGEYGTYYLSDAFSVYADLLQSSSAAAWQHVLTGGVRFEARVDARLEYVFNGRGLKKQAFDEAAAVGALALLTVDRDLIGRHYLYHSLRVADWPGSSASTSARILLSLEEASAILQVAYEQGFADRWTVFAEPTVFLGGRSSRQAAFQRYLVNAGLKTSF